MPVLKSEFDKIVDAFNTKIDPTGKLRWTVEDANKLGLSNVKFTAVRQYLIKASVIDSKWGLRTSYVDKKNFTKQAKNAWAELETTGAIL